MDEIQNKDGSAKVHLDHSKMTASLEVASPTGNGKACTLEQAFAALKDQQVVYGIKEEQVRDALLPQNWDGRVVVAQGQAPVDGQPARLEYRFPLPGQRLAPRIDDKGNADYHNVGLINNISRGELLVLKTPAEPGVPGYNVLGEPIPARPGKDLVFPRGKNTVANQENTQLFAAVDGHVSLVGGKVLVNPVFQLEGDVDFSSGDINFIGNVVINGAITSGFKVQAAGDIEIRGFIENAEVTAEGSIQVHGGITGGIKCLVKAGENLQARFVENSRIEAGKDIFIREAIMQSQVRAGGNVKVMDKRAIIVGGVIQAGQEVESKVLGSQLATQTIVEVGVNPYYREEFHRLTKLYGEKKKALDNLSHNVTIIQKSGAAVDQMDERKRQLLLRILDDYKKVRQEVQEMEERMVFLEQEYEKTNNARISVWETVYPGVRLSIGQCVHVVNDPIKYSAFILDKGEIKATSLR
ncbi:MAG TPA: FapA family protein [Syntrophomonadaceae bacterium]|nr:FapA family protein [Syntrophomonadaceae bacterium]